VAGDGLDRAAPPGEAFSESDRTSANTAFNRSVSLRFSISINTVENFSVIAPSRLAVLSTDTAQSTSGSTVVTIPAALSNKITSSLSPSSTCFPP
jgi:hypothetical protein